MLKYITGFSLLTAAVLLNGCGESDEKKPEVVRPVKVLHISKADEGMARSFPGKVEASEKADLAFRVSGIIIELPVKEGDQVKKGQLVAKLDPKDFQIVVDETKSKSEYANVQLERYTKLLAEKVTSQSKYDAQKTAADKAKADLDTALQNLEYTQLLAPFDGEIAKRYVENYQNVKEKEVIVRLHNRENIDVTVQIPESLAMHTKGKDTIMIEAEFDAATGKRYAATVKEVSSQADPDTQTYKVTLTLPAPKGLNLFPGMTTTIYVKEQAAGKGAETSFQIPVSAVFADAESKSNVWVIDPSTQTLKKQLVTLGQLAADKVLVTQGLAEGQDIVAAGVKFLKEGMKVTPYEKKGE